MTTEIQKLFPQSVQCFMGRPDYDFSFFLTDDFFARTNMYVHVYKNQQVGKQEVGIDGFFLSMGYLDEACDFRFLPSIVAEKNVTKNVDICSMCIKTN